MPDTSLPIASANARAEEDVARPKTACAPIVPVIAGYVLVCRRIQRESVVPPYRYHYSYHHYADPRTAQEDQWDYERGEYPGWEFVGIFPVDRVGLPIGRRA